MVKEKKNKLKSKLTKKFRLVVLNEDSFEERFSFKLTRLNVFVLSGIFSVLLIAMTVLLIAFTPIKEYIPGFSSTELKRQATTLFYKTDSLQQQIKTLKKFTEAIRPILIGEDKEVGVALFEKKKTEIKEIEIRIPANNDSIKEVVESIRGQIDSTFKSQFLKEKELLEKAYKEDQKILISENKTELDKINETHTVALEAQMGRVEDLKLKLALKDKNISDLEKQMALKDIENKHNIQLLSKDNRKSVLKGKLASEKVRKEVRDILKQEYRQKERNLEEKHRDEMLKLSQSLYAKEAMIDSLSFQIVASQQKKVGEIHNEIPFKEVDSADVQLMVRSKKDSIFREGVEREDRFSLFDFETDKVDVVFFAPVKGIITEEYNVKEKHYAVDVAVTKGTAVKAIADGTVIFAEWTAETGYVIIIEHTNKYLSVYKHNEIIYRKQGDLVKSGEVMSIAGSSGEYSTGPHLHFEMWYKGYPVNPVNFIEFE